jgi:hypothetical protein
MSAIKERLKRRAMDSNRQTQIAELTAQVSELTKVVEKWIKQQAGNTDCSADQEESHTVPAEEITAWNRNNANVVGMIRDAKRRDAQRNLGKEIARRFNPHYKY